MKKVGIIVNSIGYGGNERSAVNIANAISTVCDVTIIIQEDCGNHYGYNGRVINLNTPCSEGKIGKIVNSIRRIIRLRKVIKTHGIETLLIILPVSNPINYLQFGCRKIVSCRDCGDLIKRKEKYIRMTERSDLMICNSKYQEELLNKGVPVLQGKTRTIYNIIDIERIKKKMTEPISDEIDQIMSHYQCIVSVGRFAEAKGLNNLLKSFSILIQRNDNVRMILIGDGELKDKVKKMISDLHLEKYIILTGFEDNPFKYISRSKVFVLSSFYEGFPNTLIEAMACNTVVVATDCPSGPAEILCGTAQEENEITPYGLLIKPFSEKESSWDARDIRKEHESFASMLEMALSDKQLAKAVKEKAEKRVQDFTANKIQSAWTEIL